MPTMILTVSHNPRCGCTASLPLSTPSKTSCIAPCYATARELQSGSCPMIRATTIIHAPRLATKVGVRELVIASETFQHTGSFKFRGAFNLVSKTPHRLILTASSGNFGQAVAYACQLQGKECIVVMPANSARTKISSVKAFGGTVDLIDVKAISRAQRVAELAAKYPEAYVASAYDDPFVIEGNASLGGELAGLK